MRYVGDLNYMNRGFLDGQLRISNRRDDSCIRGDISAFGLEGNIFTITLSWIARCNDSDYGPWVTTERELVVTFDMSQWNDTCHGEGRIGLTKHGSDETFLIIPRKHYSWIKRPDNI